MAKYLTCLDILQSGKDYRWLRWYLMTGRVGVFDYNRCALLRRDLRMVSHRRTF